jgi:hypothetical protein
MNFPTILDRPWEPRAMAKFASAIQTPPQRQHPEHVGGGELRGATHVVIEHQHLNRQLRFARALARWGSQAPSDRRKASEAKRRSPRLSRALDGCSGYLQFVRNKCMILTNGV